VLCAMLLVPSCVAPATGARAAEWASGSAPGPRRCGARRSCFHRLSGGRV